MAAPSTSRHVIFCGIDDRLIDSYAAQLHADAGWSVVSVRWPDLTPLDGLQPLAYVVLGSYEPAAGEYGARLAKRAAGVPLVWVGGSADATARPDAWIPAPPSLSLLKAALSSLIKEPAVPRHSRRKSDEILGRSQAIQVLAQTIDRVAASTAPVLVTGESGTGKELVARALHMGSLRYDRPFVAINCAAIPETLFEAELFGHTRGAFTGAVAVRPGVFEAAHGGTLFLDEIGEIPTALQAKLLRVLETGEVTRLGSNEPRSVDVRVVAATNCDLTQAVQDKRFREDLYYRLRVCPIEVPPLRARPDDIPLLVSHYLEVIAAREKRARPTLLPSALDKLLSYDWPGNVRELIAILQRAVLLSQGGVIDEQSIGLPATGRPLITPYRDAKREFERLYYDELLRTASGQISRAAKLAGKTRKEIYDALKRLGFAAEGFRASS
jgi:two-component system response regulator GlrR